MWIYNPSLYYVRTTHQVPPNSTLYLCQAHSSIAFIGAIKGFMEELPYLSNVITYLLLVYYFIANKLQLRWVVWPRPMPWWSHVIIIITTERWIITRWILYKRHAVYWAHLHYTVLLLTHYI